MREIEDGGRLSWKVGVEVVLKTQWCSTVLKYEMKRKTRAASAQSSVKVQKFSFYRRRRSFSDVSVSWTRRWGSSWSHHRCWCCWSWYRLTTTEIQARACCLWRWISACGGEAAESSILRTKRHNVAASDCKWWRARKQTVQLRGFSALSNIIVFITE